MKHQKFPFWAVYFVIFSLFTINGCIVSNIKIDKPHPPVVKQYKNFTIRGGTVGLKNTGVYIDEGDTYSILATGSIDYCPIYRGCGYNNVQPEDGWPLMARIGKDGYAFRPLTRGSNGATMVQSYKTGYILLGYRTGKMDSYGNALNPEYYQNDSGQFSVDIIVWKKDAFNEISAFLKQKKQKDPDNKAIAGALKRVEVYKKIYVATAQAEKEVEETQRLIQEIKSELPAEKEVLVGPVSKDTETVSEKKEEKKKTSVTADVLPPTSKTEGEEKKKPVLALKTDPAPKKEEAKKGVAETKGKPEPKAETVDSAKDKQVKELEEKLAKLMATLTKLDEMKKKFEEERKKTTELEMQLEEKEEIEQDLLKKVADSARVPPVLVIASPKDGLRTEAKGIQFSGVAEDDQGVKRIEIFVNDIRLDHEGGRGIRISEGSLPKRLDFDERIVLKKGKNQIRIRTVDSEDLTSEKILIVHKVERRRNIWAVVVGINDYPHATKLKYAVNDAKTFHRLLVTQNKIPEENVTLLIDKAANLSSLRSTLGTKLKNNAGKEDMVIIFFAGHGATEPDTLSPDGDGLEKYLLPYDADPDDLYATAIPMREISHIFSRIRAQRLVFIADSCYSGASGGRTVRMTGMRANISDAFLDRIARGRGTVIITASGANEVSVEKDELEHGVFTHYLIEGLQGKADTNKNGLITVDEAYSYVSERVSRATGQEQHPIKKGAVEGELILSITP